MFTSLLMGVSQRTPPPMRACEHCQFGSAAKRAIAILVARNSNWHICRQVSVLTDVSGTRRGLQSAGNVVRSRSWLQNFIDALLAIGDGTMLLLVAGDSVTEELFYYLANREAFDTGLSKVEYLGAHFGCRKRKRESPLCSYVSRTRDLTAPVL